MRAAIIGCGFMGSVHAQALKELGHTLAYGIDASLPKAQAFAQRWQAQGFGDKPTMAFEEDIQCVHICTPPVLHYAMVKAALDAGKHVICEKPLCLSAEEAKALLLLAREKNRVHAVNFNVRFYDASRQAKDFISRPDFGKICLIHGSYLQEFHTLPAEYSWRYQPELAGPMRATTEIGSHWIDLVRFWTGLEIMEVSANYGSFTPDRFVSNGVMFAQEKEDSRKVTIDSEDAAVISIRFSNGAIGSLLLSEVSPGRINRLSIEVTGTHQSVWWNSEDPLHLCQGQKQAGITTQTHAFSGGFPDTFKDFFKAVYQEIEADRPSQNPTYPTFYDGCANAAVCTAIYASARSNSAWVKVQL
jgi:predicted dehydrogenase